MHQHSSTANFRQSVKEDFDSEIAVPNSLKSETAGGHVSVTRNLRFFLAGIAFGIILVKSQVISWFRIQEMFRLQSFHMYGVIGSAVVTGMISVLIIKKFQIKTINGEPIVIQPKKFHKGLVGGGLLFGFGWALTGACPGPLFAQVGAGASVSLVTLLSAIGGTWVYGLVRDRLPH